MIRALSVTCAAIVMAQRAGTLRLIECQGRIGPYVAIEDDHGLLEIALSMPEAEQRVREARRLEVSF
jgi:hypothetical protein